ncbi:MAG: S8 family serine peptidase [Bacteroidota bacterium]
MKKCYLLGLLMLCLATSIAAQNQRYYYADGERVFLNPTNESFIVQTLEIDQLMKLYEDPEQPGFDRIEAFPHKGYAVVKPSFEMSGPAIIQSLGFSEADTQIAPAYSLDDGYTMYPTWRIVARPKKEFTQIALAEFQKYERRNMTEKYGVYRQDMLYLSQVFEVANELHETGLFEFVHPDFYAPIERNQIADPLFTQQFQMNNTGQTIDGVTGQADADCNALEAWGVTLGSSSTTVAVIDDGMENHEDFNNSSGASRYTAGFSPANNGNGNAVNGSAHGVSCAGSIGASHNSLGVRGVAPLVNFISVNIFIGGESTQDLADGFTWAKNQGADVMSNSWGYNSCNLSFSNLNNAIADATNNGRGGLGCVITFSSGNGYNNCVNYPARLNDVIAVGAFANTGIRSAYSNYGPTLDIMAPSNNVGGPGAGVRTTDRMGGNGYSSGNYTPSFGGTSSSCPVVSGVAALVLGYNPALTQAEVKNILYSTAIDMGPPGDDLEYANGRVNALGAVNAAGGNPPTCSDGVQNGQETGVDCGGPDCPACPSGCPDNEVTLTIVLDNYPGETSWTVTNGNGQTVASGGTYGNFPNGSTVTEDICLPDGCYDFTINDSYGDGICCAYGSGSYSLVGGGSTLASGGAFGFSETTNFCVGGPGPDTQPPSTPTNLTAFNTTTTTTQLSWTASTDNVGVDGYNVYQASTLLGAVSSTGATINGLSPNTTYTFSVRAFDAAGNLSNPASVTVTTLDDAPPPNQPVTVFAHFFETGWDGWADGGSDCFRYRGSRSYEGERSIRLRDNSGIASAMTSSVYDLSSYDDAELNFFFYPNSMENGEDFWVLYNDGSGWDIIATYARGTDFQNGSFYEITIPMSGAEYNLTSNAQFRIQCDASGNGDQVYIDQITLIGDPLSSNNVGNQIVQIPGITPASEFDLGEFDLLVSPNPATELVTIQAHDPIQSYSLTNVTGQIVMEQKVEGLDRASFRVSGFPAGIYLLTVTTSEEQVTEKLVIR